MKPELSQKQTAAVINLSAVSSTLADAEEKGVGAAQAHKTANW